MQRVSKFIRSSAVIVCMLFLVAGAGCPPVYAPGEEVLLAGGPVLAEVFADGNLSCEEHFARNQYNQCPAERPEIGEEIDGVLWTEDRVFGIFPNPYHTPLDCFRGESDELGASSFQCCYDGEQLVSEGDLAGSFDFFSPSWSAILHYLYDIAPFNQCDTE